MRKIFFFTISLVLVFSLIASPALAQDTGGSNLPLTGLAEHVPGELLIRFSPGMDSAQAADKMAEMGLTHRREVQAIGVHLVKLPPGLSVEQAIARFSRMPGVEFAEPNYILHIAADLPAEVTDQWGLNKIRAPQAWSLLSASEKNATLIATVDSGVEKSRSDLNSRIYYFPGETAGNGLDDDNNGYVDDTWGWDFVNNDNDPTDDNMHGTAVSSVMVASQDGAGVAGICPWCRIMSVKVIGANGSGTLDVVANGITYAARRGARVINLSLGAASGAQTLEDAVNFAWSAGAVVVAAAGNNGNSTILYPAGYANAITVASTNSADQHSCFSNYGINYVSVAAPGEAIYVIDINNAETGYGTYSGTSLSTPHVSGLAGLLLGQNPGLTNDDVRRIIENTAVDLGQPGMDPVFGHGRIDAYRAIIGDYSQVTPPDSLSSTSDSATGFPHARKLVRDGTGKQHVIWHTYDGSLYRIRYATSIDDGASWDLQPDVFSSPYETYHSALAADSSYLYVAIPNRKGDGLSYQVLFTRKSLTGGVWSPADPIISGNYDAVRPSLFVDSTNGRLHLIASSYNNAPYLYYRASNSQGSTWEDLRQFNASNTPDNRTIYAAFYANGDNLYVVTRTIQLYLGILPYYNMWTVHSANGGQTWINQTQISAHLAWTTEEYGISLTGVGQRIYMGYEVGTSLYFRRNDGAGWSDYLTLETGDASNIYKWPSITQSEDGQAWMLFELNGQLYKRHYDGTTWQAKEKIGPGAYPNLKLGTSADRVEWIYTTCNGTPFGLGYGSINLSTNALPQANDQSVSVNEDTPLAIALTGSDLDNDPLTFRVVSSPMHGTLSGSAPVLTYTPNPNYYGPDSFTFVVNDGHMDSPPATVSITVTSINDAPVANSLNVSTPENTAVSITLTGSDPDGDPLTTYSVVTPPTHGNLSGTAPDLTYTPAAGYTETDSFTFIVSDGQVSSLPATVSITITPVVTPPTSMHIGDLDAQSTSQPKNQWKATVTITVHDSAENLIPGVVVNGTWSSGATGTSSCTVTYVGTCTVAKSNLKGSVSSVTFSVTGLDYNMLAYEPSENHDLDGDSADGTSIIVYKEAPPTGDLLPMHVGDLDGEGVPGTRNRWNATVSILVLDGSGVPVAGATVSGPWSTGASGSCTTVADGWCTVQLSNINNKTASVNFSATGLAKTGWIFDPLKNTDPDGDSNGTLITISSP